MKALITFLMGTLILTANEEISFENDFLQSLDEVSEIATKTKLNIDDAPSFVTVLHQEKLQTLGINTVFEAIGLVPGVQLKREASGVPVVVFRGVEQKGEVKLMLDGVSINNSYRGSIYHYLDFPIDLIERIEVIRGAGSVLYGSGAISGVINIITKTSNTANANLAFVSSASHNSQRIGTFLTTQIDDLYISLDSYYYDTDKNINSTDRHLNDYSVGLNINYGDFGILARIKKSDQGNAYGILGVADSNPNKYNNINDTMFTQFSYKSTLSKNNKIDFIAGINQYKQNIQAATASPIIDTIYKERSHYAEIDLISTSLDNHNLLIGARFESAKIFQSEWEKNSLPATANPTPDLSRKTSSLYAISNYSLLANMDISTGLRYDKYSDFGSSISPTLGLVYRVDNKMKLKALYSHAYRAPSWVELTSNPDLDAETSKSIEAGFVYKYNNKHTFRMNLYSFKINNMILKETTYVQNTYNTFRGAEIEYIFIPRHDLELNLFASLIDSKDEDGKNLLDISKELASLSLMYKTSFGIKSGSYLKYISKPSQNLNNTRDEISSSIILNQTFSYDFKHLKTSLIIQDLFNQGTYYALPQSKGIDFYDSGRSLIVKAIWEF